MPKLTYQPTFDLYTLVNSLDFDRKFQSGRLTKLYATGNLPYCYGTITHQPSKFSDNPFVLHMFEFVSTSFPNLQLNSCLINYYPDNQSSMPDHSDDELHIDNDSFIVTLSLGANRTMHFKYKHDKTPIACVTLSSGKFLIFSKNSQFMFTHGIPPSYSKILTIDDYMPRVSATFRKLISS